MRVQIIPHWRQPHLKDFYGCFLWKIYDVIKVYNLRSHGNCKVQKTWKEYEIEVKHTYRHNHYGRKTTIRLNEDECRIVPNGGCETESEKIKEGFNQ